MSVRIVSDHSYVKTPFRARKGSTEDLVTMLEAIVVLTNTEKTIQFSRRRKENVKPGESSIYVYAPGVPEQDLDVLKRAIEKFDHVASGNVYDDNYYRPGSLSMEVGTESMSARDKLGAISTLDKVARRMGIDPRRFSFYSEPTDVSMRVEEVRPTTTLPTQMALF